MPSFRDKLIRGKALSAIAVAATVPASQSFSPAQAYALQAGESFFHATPDEVEHRANIYDHAMDMMRNELLRQEDAQLLRTMNRVQPMQPLNPPLTVQVRGRYDVTDLVTNAEGVPYQIWHLLSS